MQLPAGKILLISQILVGRNQQIEAVGFGHRDQIAIGEFLPIQLHRAHNFVLRQKTSEWTWSILIKKGPSPLGHGSAVIAIFEKT